MQNAFIALAALSMPLVFAAEETRSGEKVQPPVDVKPKVTKLALFKNGYGYVTMSFTPVAESKHYRIADMPVPTYGTLWFETDGKSSVSLLCGKKIDRKETLQGYDMIRLAFANPGREIIVTNGKGAKLQSRVVVLDDGKDKDDGEVKPDVPHQVLCLDLNLGGMAVIPVADVAGIQFVDSGDIKQPSMDVNEPVMDVYMKQVDPGDPVRMTFISNGIAWFPTYRMELGEDGKGKLEAKADIINEFRDMENVDLELIMGFPSIQFPSLPAPISMAQPMSAYLIAFNGSSPMLLQKQRSRASAAVLRENRVSSLDMSGSFADDPFNSSGMMSPLPSAAAMSPADSVRSEDLFFYPVKGFSCAKNETLSVPLFSGEIPYERVMTWDVGELFQRDDAPQEIWHCVRITNTLDVPLTAAPVEFMAKGRLAGQNLVKFTPKGMKCIIPVNRSIDMVASGKEKVKGQEPVSLFNSSRTKLTIDGELTIINRSDKPVTVIINKTLTGIVTASSDKGDSTQSQGFQDRLNSLSLIKWEIVIPAGEKKALTYSYTRIN